jgi:hypothetical protein
MITWRLKIYHFSSFGVQWNRIDAIIFFSQFKPRTSFGTSSHLPHRIYITIVNWKVKENYVWKSYTLNNISAKVGCVKEYQVWPSFLFNESAYCLSNRSLNFLRSLILIMLTLKIVWTNFWVTWTFSLDLKMKNKI